MDALESHDFSRHFGTPNVMGDGDVNFPMGQVRCSCRRSMLLQLCHFFMDLHETECVLERIFLPFKLCLHDRSESGQSMSTWPVWPRCSAQVNAVSSEALYGHW